MRRHQLVFDCMKRTAGATLAEGPETHFIFDLTEKLHGVVSMEITEYCVYNPLDWISGGGGGGVAEDPYIFVEIDPSSGAGRFEDATLAPGGNYTAADVGNSIYMRRSGIALPLRSGWSIPPRPIEIVRTKNVQPLSMDHVRVSFERPRVRSAGSPTTNVPEFERIVLFVDVITAAEQPIDTPDVRAAQPTIAEARAAVTPHYGISNIEDIARWGNAIYYKHE